MIEDFSSQLSLILEMKEPILLVRIEYIARFQDDLERLLRTFLIWSSLSLGFSKASIFLTRLILRSSCKTLWIFLPCIYSLLMIWVSCIKGKITELQNLLEELRRRISYFCKMFSGLVCAWWLSNFSTKQTWRWVEYRIFEEVKSWQLYLMMICK